MTSRKRIGLIVNPMAGRDIRRLVAYASLQSAPEKALTVRRILAGVAAVPNMEVLVPEDEGGFFAWIQRDVQEMLPVSLVPRQSLEGDSTVRWVRMLVDAGAEALIVVGGDGTQRNVAEARPPIPVLPVAGGTNNVACYLGDQTAAGYALARFLVDGLDPAEMGRYAKVIHLWTSQGNQALALVDVAWTRQRYTGALAVWDPDDVEALVLTMADATRPGLSNVGGYVHPVGFGEDYGLHLRMGPGGAAYPVVLAPGLMAQFSLIEQTLVPLGEHVKWDVSEGGSLALDGERTILVAREETVTLEIRRDGPLILEPDRIFRALASVR
ncbi:MAG: NAD(+)/NADH kinase [Firmicutes bacterium]|nr:NAD(+)/NADH kinase [Bacillota bacterium]